MTLLRTPDGTRLRLGAELGRGGEATVHRIEGKPSLVGKVYHRQPGHPVDPGRRAKLEAMVARPPAAPAAARSLAWPHDLLVDGGGRCVGFTMDYLGANRHPVSRVFNPRTRSRDLPGFTYRYLVRTAANLAEAVAMVHDMGNVVGDLNESNVMVAPDATVTILDCDSMQVSDGSTVHPCPVAKAEYLAPELIGADLGNPRSPSADVFSLGVMVHQLLVGGTHSHAGVATHPLPESIADRIARGLTPLNPASRVSQPPQVAPYSALPTGLVDLLRRSVAVDPSQRPTAEEVAASLRRAEGSLTDCSRHVDHVYFGEAGSCPWCAQVQRGLGDPFAPRPTGLKGAKGPTGPTDPNGTRAVPLTSGTAPSPPAGTGPGTGTAPNATTAEMIVALLVTAGVVGMAIWLVVALIRFAPNPLVALAVLVGLPAGVAVAAGHGKTVWRVTVAVARFVVGVIKVAMAIAELTFTLIGWIYEFVKGPGWFWRAMLLYAIGSGVVAVIGWVLSGVASIIP